MIELSDAEFHETYEYIRARYGLNLERKKYLIESRLWSEVEAYGATTYAGYWDMLKGDASGVMERRMMDLLTTNYTFFCREERHLDFIRSTVVPGLPIERTQPLRVWSAGCASGQECYTLAMGLADCRLAALLHVPFSILGTDLSETAIEMAEKGIYESADFARLPTTWRSLYCDSLKDGRFQVKESLRGCTTFQRQNLMSLRSTVPTYDIVFCRNVLIYFKDAERATLVKRLTGALLPGGYLMIGHTESLLSIPNHLEYIQPAVYRKPVTRS